MHRHSRFDAPVPSTRNPSVWRPTADPLLDLEPNKPYTFAAHLTAADINLKSHITVQKPFDLSAVDVKFIVSGDDLADVFYLTGLALPNTPKYRLAATMQVRGTKFRMQDLKGNLGSSVLEGQVEVQTAGARPKLTAKLSSATLNMADLAPTLGTPAPKTDSLISGSSNARL